MFFSLFFNLVGFMNGVSYLYCKKFVEKSYDHCCSWLLFLKYRWYCFCFCSCCSTAYFPICLITSLLALFWIPLIDILFTKHKSTKKVGWGRGERKKGESVCWKQIEEKYCRCSNVLNGFHFFPSFISLSRINWRLFRALKFAAPEQRLNEKTPSIFAPFVFQYYFFLQKSIIHNQFKCYECRFERVACLLLCNFHCPQVYKLQNSLCVKWIKIIINI